MSGYRLRFISCSLAATALLLAIKAPAQDVNPLLEILEENVVSGASRSAERESDAPAMSSVVTAEQLHMYGIHRLDEAINFLSLGMFSQDDMSTPQVGARGVALTRDMNNHVLVVLDGNVVNEQAAGAVSLTDIPLEVVDHIEVILGPGSVLYGSNAMFGVINVVTKNAREYSGVRASSTLGASMPMASDGSLRSPTPETIGHDNHFTLTYGRPFQLFSAPAGFLVSAEYHDFKGPTIDFGLQPLPPPTYGSTSPDYGSHTVAGSWGGPVNQQWYQRIYGGYARLDWGNWSLATRGTLTTLASPQVDLYENPVGAYDDPANFNSNALLLSSLTYQKRLTEQLLGSTRLYFGYSRMLRSRHVIGHDEIVPGVPLGILDPEQCPIGPTGPCRQQNWLLSRWTGLETSGTFDWLGDGAYTTMIGVDGRLRTSGYEVVSIDEATGLSYGSNPALTRWNGGGHLEATEYLLGAYVQQSARPWKALGFNAGIRSDVDSRVPSKYMVDALSPRVAAIATPSQNVSLKLIYSKAFRAPSFLELNLVNGGLLPNPNGLKPETVSSFEAITSLRFGSQHWTLGAFYAEWKNLIELQVLQAQAPAVSEYANVPGIHNYGVNLAYETSFFERKLRLGWNSTYAIAWRELTPEQVARNAQFGVGTETPVTVAPQIYGNVRASYSITSHTITVAAQYMGRRIADQAYYSGEPSNLTPRPEAPPQLELRGVLTGPIPGVKRVGYTLGGSYAFSPWQPFVVGPNQGHPRYLVPQGSAAELAFVNRLTIFAGIDIHLDTVEEINSASTQTQTSNSMVSQRNQGTE